MKIQQSKDKKSMNVNALQLQDFYFVILTFSDEFMGMIGQNTCKNNNNNKNKKHLTLSRYKMQMQ